MGADARVRSTGSGGTDPVVNVLSNGERDEEAEDGVMGMNCAWIDG